MNVVDLDRDYHRAHAEYAARYVFTDSGPILYRMLDLRVHAVSDSERVFNILWHTIYYDIESD